MKAEPKQRPPLKRPRLSGGSEIKKETDAGDRTAADVPRPETPPGGPPDEEMQVRNTGQKYRPY